MIFRAGLSLLPVTTAAARGAEKGILPKCSLCYSDGEPYEEA